jgi:hypothetical protein
MVMGYELHWEQKGLKCVFVGEFSNDIVEVNREVIADRRFRDIEYELLDLTKVRHFTATHETIRIVAEMDVEAYKINPNVRVAIIATELVMTGLKRMYEAYMELAGGRAVWNVEVFETEEAGRNWLDA